MFELFRGPKRILERSILEDSHMFCFGLFNFHAQPRQFLLVFQFFISLMAPKS